MEVPVVNRVVGGDMSENRVPDKRRKPEEKGSLAEKLQDVKPTGSLTPGMENPDSEEIKGETSPNTE